MMVQTQDQNIETKSHTDTTRKVSKKKERKRPNRRVKLEGEEGFFNWSQGFVQVGGDTQLVSRAGDWMMSSTLARRVPESDPIDAEEREKRLI
jgi:hypothetical protein